MRCPHCSKTMFKSRGTSVVAPTKYVALHTSGDVEVRCNHCRNGVLLPVSVDSYTGLRKASIQKHVVTGGRD